VAGKRFLDGKVLLHGWNVVIWRRRCAGRIEDADPAIPDTGERLRTGYFVNKMTVDVQHIRVSVTLFNDMGIPDFVEQCFGLTHGSVFQLLVIKKIKKVTSVCLFPSPKNEIVPYQLAR
jgi:hypothetical protein